MKSINLKPSMLHRHAEHIRSWMNDPSRARKLRRQTGRWNQLCSSLDTLQQTELAMQAYAANAGEAGTGAHFLALYGLLQAMVLQQDAVCHLDEALGGTGQIGDDQELQAIRKIRNVSVGHPTKVDRRDVMSHHRISRPKLGKGFELVSEFDDGRQRFTFVSLADLLRQQRRGVTRMLRRIVHNLDARNVAQPIRLKTKNELIRGRAATKTPLKKPAHIAAPVAATRPRLAGERHRPRGHHAAHSAIHKPAQQRPAHLRPVQHKKKTAPRRSPILPGEKFQGRNFRNFAA